MTKKCIKCGLVKDIDLFIKNKNSCKNCEKEYKRKYRLKNLEKISNKSKIYYENNKEHCLIKSKKYYENNKVEKIEYQKVYYENNKESITEYKKKYTIKNRDSIREYKNNYQNNRRKNDPIFKLKHVISRTIRNSLRCKGFSKNRKTIDILGCDIIFFKSYLESMFVDEMNWINYGIIWDIDHIIPLSTAESESDVIKLNHYTNLQPLDSYINRNVKRDRLDY